MTRALRNWRAPSAQRAALREKGEGPQGLRGLFMIIRH